MRLDILGLQAFVGIAERGSFHAAASHLNLSQTALSHRIRKLEESLGLALFQRTTRQVALTPAGVELLPKARKIMAELGAAMDDLRLQARGSEERVSFGCLPTIAIRCLPRVIATFKTQFPDTIVKVHDNSASEIADKVQSGEAEFGITIVAANRWDLDLKPLVKEPFVLVCRRDHALASQSALNWTQIADLPLIRISAETGNRILIDDALGARRDTLSWRYEVQRVTTAVALVRSGAACAVVPHMAFDLAANTDLVTIPLKAPMVHRTLGVISRKGLPLTPPAAFLLDLMTKALRETSAIN